MYGYRTHIIICPLLSNVRKSIHNVLQFKFRTPQVLELTNRIPLLEICRENAGYSLQKVFLR